MGLMVSCSNSSSLNTSTSQESVTNQDVAKQNELRIVSATVAATQVLERMDVDLVGVPTTNSVLPERYSQVEKVGQAFSPDFEKIVSLTPNLTIVDSSFEEKLKEQAAQYGLDVFYFDTTSFENFKNTIVQLGKSVNREINAQEIVNSLNSSVADVVAKKTESNKDIKVALIFGTSESFMLATNKSYVGDLLNTVGVNNITDEISGTDSAYVNFSLETIVEKNPDIILRLVHGDTEAAAKAFNEEFTSNPVWQSLDAVKNNRVYDLDASVFGVTANLKVVDAINELGNIIYGQ